MTHAKIGSVLLLVGAAIASGCTASSSAPGGTGGTNSTAGTGGGVDASSSGGAGGVGQSGAGGSVGGSGGGSAGMSGDGSGMDGLAGTGEVGDGSSGETGATFTRRHGKSPGCAMSTTGFTGQQKVTIPVCTGCSAKTGNCPRDCIAPEFAPGGTSVVGSTNFTSRTFSVQLPAGYQADTAYPLYLGAGGCSSGAAGFTPPGTTGAIIASLAILTRDGGAAADATCFSDGGIACAGTAANIPLCVNGPEMPYVRGVLSYLESHFCVDLDRETMGGVSSGAWEAMTLGCGDADQLRGFVSIDGGKREHRWPCTGPMAAMMFANTGDTTGNPIGPLPQIDPIHLDSYGSAPERDSLLVRNGCKGTATEVYDPAYPLCVKYTGCPAAYPVVWCPLPGGHTNTVVGNTEYRNAFWPFLKSLPPPP
ncbi:MAG TPA: hypothetical protein VNO55_05280 [Polyangia bacterium]|nr:hypothetical protein [Polyangia bacterium]